ncbi:MAG: sulfotransferase family protein, partial [Methyloligellaceae bacterium]
ASMMEIDLSCIDQFSQQYLQHLQTCCVGGGLYITDKMPTNFLNLGLIYLLFPNAKIIHAKRDPVDTCLSCYFKRFVDLTHLSFTFDMEDLGYFYNEYLRLMDHWKRVLPVSYMEVQYEELVENQKLVTEQLIDYIGVDWDDNCLKFYENSRGVTTSSLHQVRKPMYKGAVGRWKRYEKHLGPLLNALNQ